MKKETIFATCASVGAQIIFGFSFMFTKISLDYASPMTIVAERYIIAFFVMTLIMLLSRQKIKLGRNVWKIVVMSLFQPVLYFLFETYGLKMTTSAFSSVMISLIPVVAMICAIFILKEVPTALQYVFSAISVAGVSAMALSGKSDGTVTVLGIILLLGAVFSSCGFNLTSRKYSGEFSALERTYATTIIGAVAFTLIALIENSGDFTMLISPFNSSAFVSGILYLSIGSSVIGFFLLNYANTYLPVARTTVFANITTVVSVFAGMIFLNEKITALGIFSVAMIIVGVTGVQLLGKKSDK